MPSPRLLFSPTPSRIGTAGQQRVNVLPPALQRLMQLACHVRMMVQLVLCFAQIPVQVEQLHLSRFKMLNQLPLALADGAGRASSMVLKCG